MQLNKHAYFNHSSKLTSKSFLAWDLLCMFVCFLSQETYLFCYVDINSESFCYKSYLSIFFIESSQGVGTGKIGEILDHLEGSHPANKDHLNIIYLHITIATTQVNQL